MRPAPTPLERDANADEQDEQQLAAALWVGGGACSVPAWVSVGEN